MGIRGGLGVLSFFVLFFSVQLFADTAKSIVEKASGLVKNSELILVGDSNHDSVTHWRFFQSLVESLGPDLDYLALEVKDYEQDILDEFLRTGKGEIPDIPAHFNQTRINAAFRDFLLSLRELNQRREKPLKVIAVDLTPESDSDLDWFFRRDVHMFKRLKSETNNFKGKGMIIMGALHLTKKPFKAYRLFKELSDMIDNRFNYQNLGYFLEKKTKLNISRLFTQSYAPIQKISPLFGGFLAYLPVISNLIKPAEIYSTSEPAFKQAHDMAFKSFDGLVSLTENFDYFVHLGQRFQRPCLRALKALKGSVGLN